MSKTKKITIASIAAAVVLILGISIGVYAAASFGDKGRGDRDHGMRNKNHEVGVIDSISDRTLTITLGEIEKPDGEPDENAETELEEDKKISDLFVKGTETITVTAPDDVDISTLTQGDIVSFERNDSDELVNIHNIDDKINRGNDSLGRVDAISGESIQITLGKMARPEKDADTDMENINPADNFTATGEATTYTVTDATLLENIQVGDIVRFEINDQNQIEQIFTFDGEKGMKGSRGTKDSSNTKNTDTSVTEQSLSANL